MWNTFKYTVRSLIAEKSIVIWVIIFPLVLSTLFHASFSNLEEEAFRLDPVPVAVVQDAAYEDAANVAFGQMIEALSEDAANAGSAAAAADSATSTVPATADSATADSAATAAASDVVLDVTYVGSIQEAEGLIADGSVLGYYVLDEDGNPALVAAPVTNTTTMDAIDETILADIADEYIRSRTTIEKIALNDPTALMDPSTIESLFERTNYTEQISVTANPSAQSIRYFYALLGFAALMAAMIALQAVVRTQPNLSPVGARRAIGATSRTKTLAGALLASWVLSFGCLLLAFAYMRFVLGIDFGGRDAACVLGILVASFMTTALGACIGSIPKLGDGAKGGILTAISCMLSLFAGLYGTFSLDLADKVAQAMPWLAMANPVKKVADLFYSLYFYTSYEPFFQNIAALLITAGVFTAIAALLMRRQRYASL